MENAFLKKLTNITEANLSDARFGVDELAREMGLSYSSLRRKVSASSGKSANRFIREIRLQKAFEILQTEDVTISEVAYRTGFSSPSYFNSCFHEYFGYPPGELKKIAIPTTEKVAVPDKMKEVKIVEEEATTNKATLFRGAGRVKALWAAGFMVLVVAGSLLFWNLGQNSGKIKSIAVLPFQNLGQDAETQKFSSGLEEQLRNDLSAQKIIDVRSRISADNYKNPRQLMPEIGHEINVDYTIEGTVAREGDFYTVWIKLFEAKTDKNLGSETYTRYKENLFDLEVEIVADIVRMVKAVLRPEKSVRGSPAESENPEAEQLYRAGNHYSDPMNFEPLKALEFYRKAVNLDSRLAKAYLGIAHIMSNLYLDFEARRDTQPSAAMTAIENAFVLQPWLPEVDARRGLLYYATGDFNKALSSCSVALKKDPGSPETFFIMAGSWLSLGNWIRAEERLKRVLEKNSNSPLHSLRLGAAFEHLRDFSRAEVHYREVNGTNPRNAQAIFNLVNISLKTTGDPVKAILLLDTLISDFHSGSPDSLSLCYQYALLNLYEGKYHEAVKWLSHWPKVMQTGPPYYCRPRYLMCAFAYGLMKKPELERQYYDSAAVFLTDLQKVSTGNRNDPRVTSALGIAYAGMGSYTEAVLLADKVKEQLSAKSDAFFGPYAMEDVACIYTKTGNYKEALKILKALLSGPGPLTFKLLDLDQRWAPIRNLPEYGKLKEEFGAGI